MKYKHYATITRPTESNGTDPPDTDPPDDGDWDFGDDPENPDNPTTIYENYPCNIIEKVQSYEASSQGENYTGRSTMKGMLTDKLKKGDLVDGSYKIVGRPRIVQNRETVCSLVRIN